MKSISYTLEPQDVTDAARFGFLRVYRRNLIRNVTIIAAIAAAVALFITLLNGFALDEFAKSFATLAAVYISCFFLFIPLAWYVLIPYRSKKTFKQMPAISREQQLSWDDVNISFVQKNSHVSHPFSEFYRWAKNDNAIILYPASHVFYALPRRIFPDGASYDALIRRLMETKAEQL